MLDFLKTMPDMTNTPEITMQEAAPKTSMSARIRNYSAANPDATARQIAEAVGTTAVYVYQVFASQKKKAKKVKAVKKVEAPSVADKPIKNKELEALSEEVEAQKIIIDVLKRQNDRQQAVIEYLEFKIDDLGGLV
jgi:hypothetical protein